MGRENGLWISFRGVTSEDAGARVLRVDEPAGASPRGGALDIPGRDGSLWLEDGGSGTVEAAVRLRLLPGTDRTAVAEWLSGAGDLVLGDSPAYRWQARVAGGVRFRRDEYGPGSVTAEATFTCFPFRFLVDEAALEFTQAAVFDGQGSVASRPVITVYGSGDINLMVNDCTVLLEDVDDHITLDCEAMMAFKDGENVSSQVTLLSDVTDDEWPKLNPEGQVNAVNWSDDEGDGDTAANVTRVVIRPRWRFR